jgi:hypothetical protein
LPNDISNTAAPQGAPERRGSDDGASAATLCVDLRGLELDRASALVRMGDEESALAVLTEGLTRGLIWDSVWGNDGHARPDLAPLSHNPRFQALIKPRG